MIFIARNIKYLIMLLLIILLIGFLGPITAHYFEKVMMTDIEHCPSIFEINFGNSIKQDCTRLLATFFGSIILAFVIFVLSMVCSPFLDIIKEKWAEAENEARSRHRM